MNNYLDNVYYHYILSNQIFLNTTQPEFFSNQTLKDLFNISKEHTVKYKEVPSQDQLCELVRMKGLSERYSPDIIEALYNTKNLVSQYGQEWLEKNVGAWILVRGLETAMKKSIAYMKMNEPTAETAAEVVEKVRHMITTETAVDFSFKLGVDFFDAASHIQTRLARTSTGYPFIDKCLNGGWWKGSFVVLLGAPKSGKSMWLCNLAAHSVYNGFNTAYITLELQHEIVSMRIGANILNVPLSDYEDLTKDQDLLKKKLGDLKQNSLTKLGNLHIKEFPSSTMSANDLRAYLVKAQELLGYKFDNVFIDYINIMKNWRNPNTENTYMKIKQIGEDLRAVAQEEQWAFISCTQTTRAGFDTNDLTISNVSESAALLHTVDGLFGIVADAEMKSRGEYYLKYLADRVSGMENTRKRFEWIRKYGRIEEDMSAQIEDTDYISNSIGAFKKSNTGSTQGVIAATISKEMTNGSLSNTAKDLF